MKPHLPVSLLGCLLTSASALSTLQAVEYNATQEIVESVSDSAVTITGSNTDVTLKGDMTVTGTTALNQGGDLIIDGGTLTTNKLQLHNGGNSSTTEVLTLQSGTVNVTGSNQTLPGSSGGGNNTVVIGHWGNGNATLNINGGEFNALQGLVVVSWTSPGTLNIAGGVANMWGLSVAGQGTSQAGTVNLSGDGVLNLGAGGLQSNNGNNKKFNLNGGTLGVVNSDWNADANTKLVLGGDVTVNTAATQANDADGARIGDGKIVDFKGTLSGSGTLEKTGAGTLKISGAVAESAIQFKATSGIVDFTNATLGSGTTIALNGGSVVNLALSSGLALSQTNPGGSITGLTLNGGLVSFSDVDNVDAYVLGGDLTLGSVKTTLDFSGLNLTTGASYDLFTGFDNLTLGSGTWNDADWKNYFSLTGLASPGDWKIAYNADSNSISLVQNDAPALTWNNAAASGSVWDNAATNWADGSATFSDGVDVYFSAANIEGAAADYIVQVQNSGVSPALTVVTNGSHLSLAGGSVAGDLTVNGNSDLLLGGANNFSQTLVDSGSSIILQNTGALGASATVTGTGTVAIDWGASSGNLRSQLSRFAGTLAIVSGRYEAGNTPANLTASSVDVTDGGQIYLLGGDWNQSFNLAGNGWNASGDAAKKGAMRLEGSTVSGSINLTGDASLMVYSGNATVNGSITGADYKLTNREPEP